MPNVTFEQVLADARRLSPDEQRRLREVLDLEARLADLRSCQASGAEASMPRITALEAEAKANFFLSDHLPDRLCATSPRLYAHEGIWRVPVILAYPVIGRIGEVGEVIVSTQAEEIISHTPFDEMMARARALYEQHEEAIEGVKI